MGAHFKVGAISLTNGALRWQLVPWHKFLHDSDCHSHVELKETLNLTQSIAVLGLKSKHLLYIANAREEQLRTFRAQVVIYLSLMFGHL